MSDSDANFDIPMDIKPYSFEPLAKKSTDSINCEELAAASEYVDPDSHLCRRHLAPVHNKSWIDVYLFVLV